MMYYITSWIICYRFLSQGLLSSEGAAGLPVSQDSGSSTETPPEEQTPESQEAEATPDR